MHDVADGAFRRDSDWSVRKTKTLAPKANLKSDLERDNAEKVMKSSKGKTPIGGRSKRVVIGGHGVNKQREKDPVEVYCRVRPLRDDEVESCVSVVKNNVLQITPPECSLAFKSGHRNPTQHTFKRVIEENTAQKAVFDMIGYPLTEQLLQGKNGLLFAYGITNSGKTYTMTGEPDQPGILPRSLDVLFNSIAEVQAPKYVFRPDGTNGFNIFCEAEARTEQTRNRGKKVSPRMRAESDYSELLRVPDSRKIQECIDEDSQYGVFVSYIEIYNNYVFDLLEDLPQGDNVVPKPPKSKSLREDMHHNMYVSTVTEVEVKSTEEAFETLLCGQKRRRVAQTTMNTESSRSHSVFTIRLVQAPLNHSGEEVIQDKSLLTISQLSLVDLAGSERTTRTRCRGDRLREANNINANLMVLRTCMETLRDNQTSGNIKIVPYRDSKLTHLFKNYFDGEGKVSMTVCVSPCSSDYDETIHVMRFAEVTQEVMVDRPETVKKQVGLAPGRHRANMLYKAALKETTKTVGSETKTAADKEEVPHPYLLALGVISIQKYLSAECSQSSLNEFRESLENRARVRIQLIDDLKKKQRSFREQLVVMESEMAALQASCQELSARRKSGEKRDKENLKLKSIISSQDERIARLQAELEQSHTATASKDQELAQAMNQVNHLTQERELLLRTTEMYEGDNRELQDELSRLRHRAEQGEEEKDHLRKTMTGFVSQEKEKFERLARHMKHQRKDLQTKSAQIEQVKDLIRNSPCLVRTPLRDTQPSVATGKATAMPPGNMKKVTAPPVKGKGRKRSASENWLEHVPSSTVENGGILQPQLKKKRTVSTPKPKDFQSKRLDRYCLQHQEEDSEGDIKTALYKGDIQHTRGGGTSVTFTGIETHRHSKPHSPATPTAPRRSTRLLTRKVNQHKAVSSGAQSRPDPASLSSSSLSSTSSSSTELSGEGGVSGMEDDTWTDVETRCAVAVEGRPGSTQPALTHQSITKK